MTNWENFGPGRYGPYQKVRVSTGKDNSRVFRICNFCGVLYIPKDYNAGYCPNWGCYDARLKIEIEEAMKEKQDRQEETA